MPISSITTRNRRSSLHANNAFTLLELLVVLAVIGAVLSVLPVLLTGRLDEDNMASVADQLIADLRLARSEAVASNLPSSVVIDSGFDGYTLLPLGLRRHLPNGIRIALMSTGGRDTRGIRFFPDGTSTGGRLHVELGNDRYPIDVSWPTGRIRSGL